MSLSARVLVRHPPFLLDVDLQAQAGQILAVVGPNGAGKSTLLRALAGLIPLTRGRIELAGRVLTDTASGRNLRPDERHVGVLFQDYRLFPHLSARDNVAFGLRAQGVGRRAAQARADAWLVTMDLAALAGRRPAQLSGGQAQRVALARTLATDPGLLLLDEPLAALDAGTRATVRTELRRHLVAFAGPTLLVTHDPLEAMTLADEIVVLEHGRVVQRGTPGAVARRPCSRYVGQLVGLNVFQGTAAGGVLTVAGGGTVSFAGELAGPAVAAVRPSAVTLHPAPPGASSSRNLWAGTLEALEPFGDRVRATVRAELPLLVDITVAAVADLRLTPGERVWATVKATDIDVYPAGTARAGRPTGRPAGPVACGRMPEPTMSVQALWRHPVKSMLGEELAQADVDERGLAGDREYALVDAESGTVASAKQPRLWRSLLAATAAQVDGDVRISLPGQPALAAADPDVDARLSAFLGRPVRLTNTPSPGADIDRADPDEVLERGVEAVVSAPKLVLAERVPGASFLDYAPLHLLTTATLDHLGTQALRYRANLLIRTPAGYPPYAENAWVGATMTVGADVVLRVILPTPRCASPTLAHGASGRDPHALQALMADNRIDVPGFGVLPAAGVYATVERAGRIERGAAVTR